MLVGGDVEIHGPVIDGFLDDVLLLLVVYSPAWNLVHAPFAFAQLASVAAQLEVLLQVGFAAGGEIGVQAVDVVLVIGLAIGRPAVHLLEDVEAEGVHRLRGDVPPLSCASRAQVWRNMNRQFSWCGPPAIGQGKTHHGH
ncbi:hypothetical protein D3C86_1840550 [compost metagenome]